MEENQNMMNNQNKSSNVWIIVLLILVIIGLVGYIVYSNFIKENVDNKNNKTENQTETNNNIGNQSNQEELSNNSDNKQENLDINSSLVKNLYMLVENDKNCFSIAAAKEFDIDASNIIYETKFMMAYSIMSDSDKSSLNCNDYSPITFFEKSELESEAVVSCGDNYYDKNTNKFVNYDNNIAYTMMLPEKNISYRMNQIFGENTYIRKDFMNVGLGTIYKYVSDAKGYVELHLPMGGTCDAHTNNLISATKVNNKIILVDQKTFDTYNPALEKVSYNYEYTFESNNDNNYYLTHIKSTLVK